MSFLILLVAGSAVGTLALRRFRFTRNAEAHLFRLLAGLLICAVLVLILGSVWLRLAQAVLPIIAAAGLVYYLFVGRHKPSGPARPEPEQTAVSPLGVAGWASIVAVAGGLSLTLISALAPITSWDAVVAHLALASDYTRQGRILAFEGNAYSAYPHLLHCLYTYAFAQSGERGAMLLSWVLCGLSCAAAYTLGNRMDGRRCGWIAAAILATAPIFADQAGVVSLDVAFSGIVAAALAALVAWRQEKRFGWLVLAAFLAGSACGIRHTGYVVCVWLATGVFVFQGKGRFRACVVFTAVAAAAAAPWLLRSFIATGTPFYPFLVANAQDAAIPDAAITSLGTHDSVYGNMNLRGFLMFPWDLVMRPFKFDGWSKSPGGLVLILGIPGLLVGGKRARAVGAFCLAGCMSLFFFQQFARYCLPFLVPMMAVAGVAACRMKALRWGIAAVLISSYGYGLVLTAATIHFKVPVALGLESREDYLARRVERYGAFAWASEMLPGDQTILTLDLRSYYLDRPTYQNPFGLFSIVPKSPEEQLAWLRGRDIKYFFFPCAYVNETPWFSSSGVGGMLNKWRGDQRHFKCIKALTLPRRSGDATEQVEIYEVHYDE